LLDNLWVLNYLEDIRSDFSVFHRVDEIEDVPADKFFPRVRRLVAYKGALRMTAEDEADKKDKSPTGRERKVEHVYRDVKHNPEISALGLFESGTG